jgi:hypothetical protein
VRIATAPVGIAPDYIEEVSARADTEKRTAEIAPNWAMRR